jgi:hypothetical protein
MLLQFSGIDRKSAGGGLTRLHDFGGMDSCGGGKGHLALLQPSDICYYVLTLGVNVAYLLKGLSD